LKGPQTYFIGIEVGISDIGVDIAGIGVDISVDIAMGADIVGSIPGAATTSGSRCE
jgi:hypothetical protein